MSIESIRQGKPFLVFGAPLLEEDEIQEVVECMRTGWLGTGPKVQAFEKALAAYKGIPYAMALNSCTAALHLSILAAGIGKGDEVITTPMTFCATVNAILHAGATPVLVDIDPATLNIDPAKIEAKITSRTKAILPVHFAGRACDMDELMEIAGRHELKVIEDCAHAIETEYKGRKAGTFGDLGCFSFYVTKNIVTGEGGMVISSNEEMASRIKILGLHGMSKDAWKRFSDEGFKHYQVVEAGFKYNMMDLQAAIGTKQLAKIDRFWERRKQIWNRYQTAFKGLPIDLPSPEEPQTRHAYHLYTIQVEKERAGISRDAFLDRMTGNGIGVGVHYLALTEHPFYQNTLGWRPEDTPHATRIGRSTVSLPISPKLTDDDVEDVIAVVKQILSR
jgi:dTDP-4-amino-4,6-dideoxygalactose transaminase